MTEEDLLKMVGGALVKKLSAAMGTELDRHWTEFWSGVEEALRKKEGAPPEHAMELMKKWMRIGYSEGFRDGGLTALQIAEKARDFVNEMRHEEFHAPQDR